MIVRLLVVAIAFFSASWGAMILLARKLPPGLIKDLAATIPAGITAIQHLRKDPRVPKRVKIAVIFAGLWVLSPIDLIPEFLPIIGPIDDIVVIALTLRYASRRISPETLADAWPKGLNVRF